MTKPLGQLSQSEKSDKPEKKEFYWTPTEKESLKETYGTEILIENGSLDEVSTTEAPSDAWKNVLEPATELSDLALCA